MPGRAVGTRTIALVGPGGAGKTSLAEALLFAAGAVSRQGSVADGTSVGDSSPEARPRPCFARRADPSPARGARHPPHHLRQQDRPGPRLDPEPARGAPADEQL